MLEDAYVVAPNVVLTPSTKKLVAELCELGWLFKKVNDWNQRNVKMENQSKVIKSLCFAIDSELKEYYRLIALLDSQRTQFPSQEADPANFLNLRKLYLWV